MTITKHAHDRFIERFGLNVPTRDLESILTRGVCKKIGKGRYVWKSRHKGESVYAVGSKDKIFTILPQHPSNNFTRGL